VESQRRERGEDGLAVTAVIAQAATEVEIDERH
jgi:hypothetical protein